LDCVKEGERGEVLWLFFLFFFVVVVVVVFCGSTILCLVLVDEGLAHRVNDLGGVRVVELEDALDDADFGGGGVDTAKGRIVVDDETSAKDVRATVDGSNAEGNLQEGRELVLLLDGGSGVDHGSLVVETAVAAHQRVVGDRVTEDLHTQHVRHDFLGLAVNIRVDEGDVVVADDDVTKGRKTLLDTLDDDGLREGVTDVEHLLIGAGVGEDETLGVSDAETADDFAASNTGGDDGKVLGASELGVKEPAEVL